MFTLTLVELEYKPVFLFGNLKWLSYLYDSFAIISARYTIKFTNHNWNWVY